MSVPTIIHGYIEEAWPGMRTNGDPATEARLLPASHQPLVLEYSDEAWREVEGKLSQFVEPRPGTFNWLTMEGDVEVLISTDGKW